MKKVLLSILIIGMVLLAACAAPPAPAQTPPPETAPAPTPAPSPPPEPTLPPKSEGVEVQNCKLIMYDFYRKHSDVPYTVQAVLTGEVINNTSDNVKLIKLFVRLKDVDIDVPLEGAVGAKSVVVFVPILRPGEASPFMACGATGYKVTDFEVEVEDYTRTTEELYSEIEVSESQGYEEVFDDTPLTKYRCMNFFSLTTGYIVKGKVKNIGNREARFVQVVCTFYDDSGCVVDVDESSLDYVTHLPRGTEATFTMGAVCSPELVSDFKIQVVAK